MKKVVFVYDDVSKEISEKLYLDLINSGVSIDKKGCIPTCLHRSEEEIRDTLHSIIKDASLVIGISSSGNGIAIFANKIDGFIAAPISSFEDAVAAIKLHGANTFDVSAQNNEAFHIYKELLEGKVNSNYEMG